MAKKRRRTRKKLIQRNPIRITKRQSLLYEKRKIKKKSPLVDDHRKIRYLLTETPLLEDGRPVSYHLTKPKKNTYKVYGGLEDRLTFINPKKVPVCQRRKKRREVLFSLQKAGKGKGSRRKRHYNDDSKIKC